MEQKLNQIVLQICRETGNFFEVSREHGDFSLSGGGIILSGNYKANQYIALTGSILVNGIYKIAAANSNEYMLENTEIDEDWNGVVYGLAIPPDFIDLCGEIREFTSSPDYSSTIINEHHKDYSYTVAANKNGSPIRWQQLYADRLGVYRKMFKSINI